MTEQERLQRFFYDCGSHPFGRFSETKVPQEKVHALRELCRDRFYIVDTISDLKRKVIALVDQVFPEYGAFFSDVFGAASKEVLLHYPTLAFLQKIRVSTLTSLLIKYSGGYFGKAKAIEIIEVAKSSSGVERSCGVYADLILSYMKYIKFTSEQVAVIDKKVADLMEEFDTPITTISGIGPILGAVIVSEIGDISRFKSADKLAAFAEIDPTVKLSGDFVGSKNHMYKRGTRYLRRAFLMASTIAVMRAPMFKVYYEKKSSEGMKCMEIIGHVTKKMAAVVFAVLRDNKPYSPILPASDC